MRPAPVRWTVTRSRTATPLNAEDVLQGIEEAAQARLGVHDDDSALPELGPLPSHVVLIYEAGMIRGSGMDGQYQQPSTRIAPCVPACFPSWSAR